MAESTWGAEARTAFANAREPRALATAVVKFHRRVDEVMSATVAGHGIAVACRRGCSYCCSLRVDVQPAETFALADWLKRHLDAARLADVVAKLRANVARTRELGAEARKRTNIACALLAQDGSCSAYAARPAQCRRYHSLRVETCASFYANPANEELESPMHAQLAHNAAVIVTQTQHALRAGGLDADNQDMNVALLAALENPKAWRRWRDGKKPFVD